MALDIKDIEKRMHGAIESLKTEFGGLRAGRASTSLLDTVVVDVLRIENAVKSGWICFCA